ncbi:unnamed protein product, partial [Symbiodinium sp. KB8]
MDRDIGLQALVQRLDNAVRFESRVLEASYEKWRASQDELHEQYELLQEERGLLKEERAALDEAKAEFEEEVSKKWGSADGAPGRIRLNVGGQVFETSPSTLTKDRFSLLAAIVTQPPPATSSAPAPAPAEEGAAESKTPAAEPAREAGDAAPADSGRSLHGGGGSHFARNASGTVFIDRDWWVFRHILAFLRHDSLPSNLALLRQLYIESAYYRLHSLRTAIERKLAADDVPGEALAVEEAGALPGPHAGFALGATPAGGDYTDTGVREAVERRAQDTL